MAYTPGPWKIQKGGNFSNIIVVGSHNAAVATFQAPWYPAEEGGNARTEAEAAANARLIAAAPDLLQALRAFLGEHDGKYGVSATPANIEQARAAIAKATKE